MSGPHAHNAAVAVRGVRVHANAKVNLLLRVLARETSGYHAIETVFQRLALHDAVTIRVDTAERSLAVDGPMLPPHGLGEVRDNLAWRAAEAFARVTGWPTGFHIHIDKQIPVGGGLGGGSADAAAVLRGLNAIAPRPLDSATLVALGGTLGADVAFLTSDALTALAWGRGDRLLALPPLPARPVVLVAFPTGVNTAAAYGALAAHRAQLLAELQTSHEDAHVASRQATVGGHPLPAHCYPASAFATWEQLASLAANDFETVVPMLHVGVGEWLPRVHDAAKDASRVGATIGMLSGSGATCFVAYPVGAEGPMATHLTRWQRSADGTGVHLLETATASAIVAPEPIV